MRYSLTLTLWLVLVVAGSGVAQGQSNKAEMATMYSGEIKASAIDDANVIGAKAISNARSTVAKTSSEAGMSADKEGSSAPTVYFVAPQDSASYVAPAAPMFYVTASATSPVQGTTIDHVDFLDGETVVGTVQVPNSDPIGHGYAFVWNNPALGTHLIYARATDTLGNAAMSVDSISGRPKSLRVSIVSAHAAPDIGLMAPSTGAVFTVADTVPLSASASSTAGSIQRVEFLAADRIVGTIFSPPYFLGWNNPPPGIFAIVAKAYDDLGFASASPAAYIQVLQTSRKPTVVLMAPSNGTTIVAGSPVSLSAAALAPDSDIARVDYRSGTQQIGSSTSPPYSATWSAATAGVASVTATAIDLLGNSTTSAPVAVTVTAAPVLNVVLTAPANATTFVAPANIALRATADESGGSVSKVEFVANGNIIATMHAPPFAYSWAVTQSGSYTFTARATDAQGVVATSQAVNITVSPSISPNQPPVVAITAPTAGQSFNSGQPVTLVAGATDADGTISRLEFLVDGAVVATSKIAPYSATWTTGTVGQHALAARATDNKGATATSAAVIVAVTAHDLPTVTLTAPRGGQIFGVGAPIVFAATASAFDAAVSRVEFYGDGTIVGASTAAPFTAAWVGASIGAHTLFAKVIDSQGASNTSPVASIQVATSSLTIATPLPNASIDSDFVLVSGTYQAPANSGVTVNGVVARNDGQGRFFANNVPLALGANNIAVTLTTADGQATTQTLPVTSAGAAPMQIYADSDAEFAPNKFTIRLTNRTGNTIAKVSYDLAGGQLDTGSADQTTLGTVTYSDVGTYALRFIVTDGLGNVYTQTLGLLARDKGAVDQMFKAVWSGFGGALAAGDIQTATKSLSGNAQVRYGPVFTKIAPSLTGAVASWGPPQMGAFAEDVAEYTVRRSIGGVNRIYFIYFLLDPNGIWQIDSM